MSKGKLNNDKDVRRKARPKDYEKGAIVYLHLFRKLGSTEAIIYPKFSSKWISWFPEDDYGCGKIFKKVFHETVIKAGKSEESIKEYLDTIRICKDEYIPKEIHEIAKRKGCKVKRSNNHERYLSGYMVTKDCAKKYRNNKSAILIGLNYDCTLEGVENYLNNLPDSIDVRRSQTELQKILDVGGMDEKVKAIRSYPYWICTYDFNVFLFKYARSCDTQTVLNAIVKLCKKLNVTHMSNKEYEWKDKTKFNPSILFNQSINVDIKDEKYKKLGELMFKLKRKEQLMTANIDSVIKNLSKSDGIQEKISRYTVFYDMCEKMIVSIFEERHDAAEYLLNFEYLQRDNENYGKNILWNCFGDLILDNIYHNVKLPNIRERRKHYTTKAVEEQKKIEKLVVQKIVEKGERKIPIEKEELVWINQIHYRKNCSNDRELLFILLFLNKRDGKVWLSSNKKNSLTCNKLDKWIGDGVSIAKKGIQRLKNMGVIEITEHGKDMEIHVNTLEFESNTTAYDIPATAKNPLIYFYKHNRERVVAECTICKELFIKTGNKKTCSDACGNELERRRKRKVS